MIILSFLVFVAMFMWMIASALAAAIGLAAGTGSGFLAACAGVFSLVCWYQVLVWGEPWFRKLAAVWV